jgi:pilus assembly protein Flp/PilA
VVLARTNGFDFTLAAIDDHHRPGRRSAPLEKERVMLEQIKAFLMDEEGASAVEYGLIIGLVAVALILVLGALSGSLGGLFNAAGNELDNAAGG